MASEQTLPYFDEIHVISDIHMGGKPGFQILKHGPRLGAFIEDLAGVRPGEKVALVLNGDVIDSLAEEIDGYIAMEEAQAVLQRISKDLAFAPVWEGLANFLAAPNRWLILVIGNHDIELALPPAEGWIRQRLAGGDPERNGRIYFATHGAGFACRVGKARVFCTHGNEVDAWNLVDYDRLAQLGNAMNAGRVIDRCRWEPNAGTRLVVDTMNQVKRDYPFVDLLKPESMPLFGVMAVMAPELVGQLKVEEVAAVAKNRIRGALVKRGLLSAAAGSVDEVGDTAAAAETVITELLGSRLREEVESSASGAQGVTAEELLLEVEEEAAAGTDALELEAGGQPETLGVIQMVVDRIRGVDKVEALRRALLDWLEDDETFDLDRRDDTFKDITARVGADVDFIVTGHTHLQRAVRITDGVDRFYYNSGTWIRLLRLTKTALSKREFPKVYKALKAGSMKALDQAKIKQPQGEYADLVLDRTASVCISVEQNDTVGRLYEIKSDDDGGNLTRELVKGSEFRWIG